MATAPQLPDDEEPLDAQTLDRFLSNVGEEMVLVGGQALAFWMDRYGIDTQGAAISNDGDVLGSLARAQDLAQALKAGLLVPGREALTSLVAQVRIPVRNGKARNIDVLHLLYTVSGLRKSNEFTRQVQQRAVKAQWRGGRSIRVMHPLDVLESRVHNAAGLLADKGPHVLTQAQWAIAIAREALLRVARAREPGAERIGQLIQRVYRLSRSRAGRKLRKDHGIDVLDAIAIDAIRRTAPEQEEQLQRVEAARRS